MKLLFTILNLLLLILNVYAILFLKGVKEFKMDGKIENYYSYILLEDKIKNFYNTIDGQNIIIEKGSNIIVKEKIYMVTKDTIISGIFEVIKDGKSQKKPFTNISLNELYNKQKSLNSVLITSFGKEKVNEQINLPLTTIKNILKGEFQEGKYIEIF